MNIAKYSSIVFAFEQGEAAATKVTNVENLFICIFSNH